MTTLILKVTDLGTASPLWTIDSQPKRAGFEVVTLDHGLLWLKGYDGEVTLMVTVMPIGSTEADISVTMSRVQEPARFLQEQVRLTEEAVADAVNRLIAALLEE